MRQKIYFDETVTSMRESRKMVKTTNYSPVIKTSFTKYHKFFLSFVGDKKHKKKFPNKKSLKPNW